MGILDGLSISTAARAGCRIMTYPVSRRAAKTRTWENSRVRVWEILLDMIIERKVLIEGVRYIIHSEYKLMTASKFISLSLYIYVYYQYM